MKTLSAFTLILFLGLLGYSYIPSETLGTAPRCLTGQQGATGICTAVAGDVGKFLKVSDDSPLTYTYDTASGGSGAGNSKWATTSDNTNITPNSATAGIIVQASSTFSGAFNARGPLYASSTSLFNGLTSYSSSTWQAITATTGRFLDVFQASSTALFGNGLTTYASSTFQQLRVGGVLQASSTALFSSGLSAYSSSTFQNFTAVLATTSQATTTNFHVSTSATSTFGGGIFLSGGCVANADGCFAGGGPGGSGTVNSGLTGRVAYYTTDGTAIDDTPLIGYASTTNEITIFGLQAGGQNATTSATNASSVAFGFRALNAQTTGSSNSAFGHNALRRIGTGSSNTAVGADTLDLTTGSQNTGVGSDVLGSLTTGSGNVGVGFQALTFTTGSRNIALGTSAGQNSSFTGSDNILIGTGVSTVADADSQKLNIGNLLYGSNLAVGQIGGSSSKASVGQIGIATNTPFATLSVAGGSLQTTPLFFISSSTAVATSTALTVDSNGKMGIGSTTPWADLSVQGKVAFSGLTVSASTQAGYLCIAANFEVINDSSTCLVSARRFKKNIETLDAGLATLLKLRPVSYFLKNPAGNNAGEQVGFIADEAASVDERLVTRDKDGEIHAFRYENFTAVLTNAIQDFYEEFQQLMARVSGLEGKLTLQEKRIQALEKTVAELSSK
jgi:hypothetical protein